MNNLIFGHQVTERNRKSPSLIHCRIASLLKSLILVLIIRSDEHILFKNGKSRLTWRVRCRRLRRLIWSPMRIALRGKVPTQPWKYLFTMRNINDFFGLRFKILKHTFYNLDSFKPTKEISWLSLNQVCPLNRTHPLSVAVQYPMGHFRFR